MASLNRTLFLLALQGYRGGTVHQVVDTYGLKSSADILHIPEATFRDFVQNRVLEYNEKLGQFSIAGNVVAVEQRGARNTPSFLSLTEFGSGRLGLGATDVEILTANQTNAASNLTSAIFKAVPALLVREGRDIFLPTADELHDPSLRKGIDALEARIKRGTPTVSSPSEPSIA